MNNTNFLQALKRQDSFLVKSLLKAGFDANARFEDGQTALHYIVKEGNSYILSLLLSHKANPNVLDSNNLSPLFYAIQQENSYFAAKLLEHGAKPDMTENPQMYLLHECVKKDSSYLGNLLIKHKANLNVRNENGETPLFIAVNKDNSYLGSKLLENGADVNIPNSNGVLPLDVAIKNDNNYLISKILKNPNISKPTVQPQIIKTTNKEEISFFDKLLKLIKSCMVYLKTPKAPVKANNSPTEEFEIGKINCTELKKLGETKFIFKTPQLAEQFDSSFAALQKKLVQFLKFAKRHETNINEEIIENMVFLKNNFKSIVDMNNKIDSLTQDIASEALAPHTQELSSLYSKFSLYILTSQNNLNDILLKDLEKTLAVENQTVENKTNKKLQASI